LGKMIMKDLTPAACKCVTHERPDPKCGSQVRSSAVMFSEAGIGAN
jgi:hypothetical protein